MDLFPALLSAVASASALMVSEHVQRRFFVPYFETHSKEPRQAPLVRMGLGLDDTFGPWDFIPAWGVLNRPGAPELEQRRRSARIAFIVMPVVAIAGPVLFGLLRSPAIGIGWFAGFLIGTAFRGWGVAMSVSRNTYTDDLDRTSRIVLGITMVMPFAAIIAAMLLVMVYRAR